MNEPSPPEQTTDSLPGLTDTTVKAALADEVDDALGDAAVRQALFGLESAPTVVGRFVTIKTLGRGSFGTVYLAYDPFLDRRVALKILARRDGGDAMAALLGEARALARLEHPNIVTIYDAFETPRGMPAIAMGYVEGVNAHTWALESDTVPHWREVVEVFARAADGMAAAHAAGIVHRDFKPANVMVSKDGSVRVTDFGLAVTVADAEGDATEGFVGTPIFLPPEAFSGKTPGPAGDVYAFCVSLQWALARERPYQDTTQQSLGITKIAGPLRLPPGFPGWLAALVADGTQPDPSRRPTFAQICDRLSRGRRRLWRPGVVVAVASVAIAFAIPWGFGRADCEQSAARLDAVWGPNQREALRRTLVASGSEDAAAAAERTVASVDRYAARWRPAREQACWSLVSAEPDVAVDASQRAACLDDGLVGLEAVLDVVGQADASGVSAIDGAIAQVLDPVACDDPDRTRHLRPPDDPQLAPEVAAVRLELAGLRARLFLLRSTADEYRLRTLAEDPVLARAAGLRAELTLRVASDVKTTLSLAERTAFAQAGVLLAEEHRFDGLVLEGLFTLGHLQELSGELRGAQEALARAQAWSRRLADDRIDEGSMALARGRLLFATGDLPAAIEALLEAAALGDRSPDTPALAMNARMHLANAYQQSGRPQEALEVLEVLERLVRARPEALAQRLGAVQAMRARVLMELGDATRALEVGAQALDWLRDRGTPPEVTSVAVLHGVGAVYLDAGRLDQAEAVLREASAIAHAIGSGESDVPDDTLGVVLRERGRFAEALAVHRRALESRRSTFGVDDPRVPLLRVAVAEDLQRMGRCDEAVPLAREAVEDLDADHAPQDSAPALLTIARCQATAGLTEDAAQTLQDALTRTQTDSPSDVDRENAVEIQAEIDALQPP